MLILRTPHEMQDWTRSRRSLHHSIGFVPTMGALHEGHEVLIQHSTSQHETTALSIFVNPTQFNVVEDFEKYPRTFESDVAIAERLHVDVIYAPTVEVMYPAGASVTVQPGSAANGMEGAMRPGHFAGVTTVVAKLFNAVQPTAAYFGKKDYQQLAVIKQMVRDLNFPVDVIGVETVRASDGLALSSRNVRLTPENRQHAVSISEGLFAARAAHLAGIHDAASLKEIVMNSVGRSDCARTEYVEVCDQTNLTSVDVTHNGAVMCIAAWFGDVRLIDNVELAPL